MRNLIQKLLSVLSDWRNGVFGRKPVDHGDPKDWVWQNDAALNDALSDRLGLRRVVTITPEARKNIRLAEIAAERSAIKDAIQLAIKQKKPRLHLRAQLAKLTREELWIEGGR